MSAQIDGQRRDFFDIPFKPRDPVSYRPPIGLIGCGGITGEHLTAYRAAGYQVVALCDINLEAAENRRQEFFPEADVYENYVDLLRRDDIEVVDIATHTHIRPPIVEKTLKAGKHVLSQKPFVLDLDMGERLVDVAVANDVKLAVNQNGRWSPHFSYLRHAVSMGVLGEVHAARTAVHWDHTWVKGTQFEKIKHLILYDFAIHWFDIISCFMQGKRPQQVYASTSRTPTQTIFPPLLGQALIEFEEGQASLTFDADTQQGAQDSTIVIGSQATASSIGPSYHRQHVTLSLPEGSYSPNLTGDWFPDGFHGTMGELLCAIEEAREPSINAVDNMRSLALCFAAVMSAERGEPVVPGKIRRLPLNVAGISDPK